MKSAIVYYNGMPAGRLSKIKSGYEFQYFEKYLENPGGLPVSATLPLKVAPYVSERLFPFFEGLVSEGWLLKIQSITQKIDENDTFKLLIENGKDLIGAVTVEKEDE
ncbi:MAG: HipA N-terminal domain-containing protein [Victivallales bacterium]